MKHVTVRNLPPQIATALEKEKRRRGKSLNQTVIELLGQILGVGAKSKKCNGLAELAGGWTATEFRDFEAAVAVTEQVDEELWH